LLVNQDRGVGRSEDDGVDGFALAGRKCIVDFLNEAKEKVVSIDGLLPFSLSLLPRREGGKTEGVKERTC
jgi:hypothetical protein